MHAEAIQVGIDVHVAKAKLAQDAPFLRDSVPKREPLTWLRTDLGDVVENVFLRPTVGIPESLRFLTYCLANKDFSGWQRYTEALRAVTVGPVGQCSIC